MAKVFSLEELKNIPDKPGVYLFKDEKGDILYVGKALSLKKRISSYYRKSPSNLPKIEVLKRKISDLEFYITQNEIEALILECNLIKKYRPPYNVNLRDDKSYPYLAITMADTFPRALVTRNLGIEGAKYFGPYTKAHSLRTTLTTLRKLFPIRTCKGKEPGRKSASPCLNYHINKCLAPCIRKISPDDYRQIVDEIIDFMEGKGEKVIKKLEKEMKKAAENLEFEKAALIRDKIKSAQHVMEKQKVIFHSKVERDIIGFYEEDSEVYVRVFFIREGKMIGSRGYILRKEEPLDFLTIFLNQLYLGLSVFPKEIYLPRKVDQIDLLEKLLKEKAGRKVAIKVPKAGKGKELVEMANENAAYSYSTYKFKGKAQAEIITELLEEVKKKLHLLRAPFRIECFDISAFGGREAVGSMVVFEDGKPKKKDYRRFKIRTVKGQDDFAMMKEVIERRLKRLFDEESKGKFGRRPDLIIVDGGKSQLSAAQQALKEAKIKDISLIALAKREEKIFHPDFKEAIVFPYGSSVLKLLQQVRDESHRFALAFHRQLRAKKIKESKLDQIPQIGEKRKRALLKKFGSLEKISQASINDLQKVLPEKVAREVYQYFH